MTDTPATDPAQTLSITRQVEQTVDTLMFAQEVQGRLLNLAAAIQRSYDQKGEPIPPPVQNTLMVMVHLVQGSGNPMGMILPGPLLPLDALVRVTRAVKNRGNSPVQRAIQAIQAEQDENALEEQPMPGLALAKDDPVSPSEPVPDTGNIIQGRFGRERARASTAGDSEPEPIPA